MIRRSWLLVGLGALAFSLVTAVSQVRPGERAVVRRFGRVVATPGPGLWIGLPWGLESVERIAVDRVRRATVGYLPEFEDMNDSPLPGQLLTGDQNLVNIQVVVDYAIDASAVAEFAAVMDRAEGMLVRSAEALIAEWTASRPVDEVLLNGKAALPVWLAARLRERLKPFGFAIDVQSAGVTYLAPPEEVRAAFSDVTRAQAGIRTREQEAGKEADERLRQAEKKVNEVAQAAAAAAHEQLARAEADAAGFQARLAQFRRSPGTGVDRLIVLWWEELGPIFTKMRSAGRLDVLDAYLGPDGLDIMQVGPRSKPQ